MLEERDYSLVGEIRKFHDRLLVYNVNQQNVDLSQYTTVLINFKNIDECSNIIGLSKLIDNALALGMTLILLNVSDGKPLSRMIGMGLRGKCIIVRSYPGYRAFNILGLYQEDMDGCGEGTVNQEQDGERCFNVEEGPCCECTDNECFSTFEKLCVAKQARIIESILATDFEVPHEFLCNSVGDTPASLPESQFKLNYLAIESTWNLSETQVTNNSVIMEITLIASYNPKYKYLRIRSVGAGFNPANGAPMDNNSTYDRGFFQSAVKIHMQPETSLLKTLSTDPKNVNNQAQYTTSSSFSVGVDVSKNPTFKASYDISESLTTLVSDFNIYNNGAGVTADWDFLLSMTENSIWDIFSEPFMKKGQVKALPALATKNLQAVTEAVWYGEDTLTDSIGVQLYWKVDHFHCWVTGNWASYTEHYYHKWRTVGYVDTPVYIDFSSVFA